jgi:hypothetical protein
MKKSHSIVGRQWLSREDWIAQIKAPPLYKVNFETGSVADRRGVVKEAKAPHKEIK